MKGRGMPRRMLFKIFTMGASPDFFFFSPKLPRERKPARLARAREITCQLSFLKEEWEGFNISFLTDSFFSSPGNESQNNKERILPC